MGYGLTLEQVRQINQPSPLLTSWGTVTCLTEKPEYAMYRVEISAGSAQPLRFFASAFHAFVESGDVTVRLIDSTGSVNAGTLSSGQVLPIPRFLVHAFSSVAGAVIYLFGPRAIEGLHEHLVESLEQAKLAGDSLRARELTPFGAPTSDVRHKYWGSIETIVSGEVAAKRIVINKGGAGSLEFHVEKSETYCVHSGLIRVGLRIGRAENHSIILRPGESYDIRPGVMHLREGLEDSVILEVSTRDSDSDSYLVEDGQTYRHVDTKHNLNA